jgi:prepilin-type N-terminal cleavage/methylation domain-containing protein
MYLQKISYNKGFTMIELLIVAALMMFLLALSAPFASSLRSDIAMNRTLQYIKSEIVTDMAYSISGKSITASVEGDLMNPDLIPSYYALYFQTAEDYGADKPHYYVEMRTDMETEPYTETGVMYKIAKELPSPTVYLREIRVKKDNTDTGTPVDSVFMVFVPPFGKVLFLSNMDSLITADSTFDSDEVFREAADYKAVELDFQYKDEEQTLATLRFGTDKVLNIL